jgi:hypothetical protein
MELDRIFACLSFGFTRLQSILHLDTLLVQSSDWGPASRRWNGLRETNKQTISKREKSVTPSPNLIGIASNRIFSFLLQNNLYVSVVACSKGYGYIQVEGLLFLVSKACR